MDHGEEGNDDGREHEVPDDEEAVALVPQQVHLLLPAVQFRDHVVGHELGEEDDAEREAHDEGHRLDAAGDVRRLDLHARVEAAE